MRSPSAIAARIRSTAAAMSPSRTGSCGDCSPARKARDSSGSPYPRRTSTLAVISLMPSSLARALDCRCGHGRIVQLPCCIARSPYGERRTDAQPPTATVPWFTRPVTDPARIRDEFMLDPDVVFLNHGSFGACPRDIVARYQEWQLELERRPVEFLARRLQGLLAGARESLGAYVGADPDDLVFVPNATAGVNIAAWALDLQPGDEVLSTNLEYGGLDLTWKHVCAHAPAQYVRAPVTLPLQSD